MVEGAVASSGSTLGLIPQANSTREFVEEDANCLLLVSSNSAVTLTIPLDDDPLMFPNATQILVAQMLGGQVEIAAAQGVSLYSKDDKYKTASPYCMAYLVKIGANKWLLSGDLIA